MSVIKPKVTEYFCNVLDYRWHKLDTRVGETCIAMCGFQEENCQAEVTTCVFIGERCAKCFAPHENFNIEQCGY